MTGKFTDVMKAAKTEKQKSVKAEKQIASLDEDKKSAKDKERVVNVCIKVPKSLRKNWTLEATQQDLSLKDFIIEAVKDKWGV